MSIRGFDEAGLPKIRDEWVVLNERSVLRRADGAGWVSVTKVRVPASRNLVWEGDHPEPWNPRRLGSSAAAASPFRVRVYRAP